MTVKQSQPLEVNTFVKGLISEASPVNFPPDASKDEDNFILNRDGTRDRRLGMDFEADNSVIKTGLTSTQFASVETNTFKWDNVAQDPQNEFAVVQIANKLYFFDTQVTDLSTDGAIGSLEVDAATDVIYSFSEIDGKLAIATGEEEITIVEYDPAFKTFSRTSSRLLVRDLWGLEDVHFSDAAKLTIGSLTSDIVFDASAGTISCADVAFDFTTSLAGDQVVIAGTSSNNTTVSFTSYAAGVLTISGALFNETILDEVVDPITGTSTFPSQRTTFTTYIAAATITNTREGSNISFRPDSLSDPHLYNLRNQSWGAPRRSTHTNALDDTITVYNTSFSSEFPSNADVIWGGMEHDPDDGIDVEEFNPVLMKETIGGLIPAARGGFIIDALNRGPSREAELTKLEALYPQLDFSLSGSLPEDRTEGGPTQLVEYAGRIFYGGFGGSVMGGDAFSPKLASYLLFSRAVKSTADITACYQDGDPTSRDTFDIVSTDGGFVRISGCQKILKLVNLGTALVVVGTNGVWLIQGGSDFGFSADNFQVKKITDYGAISSTSVVEVGSTIFYWAKDGIYQIAADQFGDYGASNITENTIQKIYDDIDVVDRANVFGLYDKFDRKIRWLYGVSRSLGINSNVRELILDTSLGAFYPSSVKNITINSPRVGGLLETSPFERGVISENVTINAVQVTINAEDVVISTEIRETGIRSIKYLTILTDDLNDVGFTFSEYRNGTFRDWFTADGVGEDALGFILTGALTANASANIKQTPYLIMHFRQTETGYELDGSGDIKPSNQSGCLVRSQWDWSNNAQSGRWSSDFQAYRLKRPRFTDNVESAFNYGFDIIQTKNKLRGRGKALSIYMQTEPNKDCRIVGWVLTVNGNPVV